MSPSLATRPYIIAGAAKDQFSPNFSRIHHLVPNVIVIAHYTTHESRKRTALTPFRYRSDGPYAFRETQASRARVCYANRDCQEPMMDPSPSPLAVSDAP